MIHVEDKIRIQKQCRDNKQSFRLCYPMFELILSFVCIVLTTYTRCWYLFSCVISSVAAAPTNNKRNNNMNHFGIARPKSHEKVRIDIYTVTVTIGNTKQRQTGVEEEKLSDLMETMGLVSQA